MEQTDLRYLKSLAKQYPTVAAAATEIINLQAILRKKLHNANTPPHPSRMEAGAAGYFVPFSPVPEWRPS